MAPPVLDSAAPALVCLTDGDVALALAGQGFLLLADGTAPTVDIGGVAFAAGASGCTALAGGGGELCTSLDATLTAGSLAEGVHPVVVANPEPAACVSEDLVEIEVVAGPVVASMDPAGMCAAVAADTDVVITGTGFVVLADGTGPTVTFGGLPVTATPAFGAGTSSTAEGACADPRVPGGSYTFGLSEEEWVFGASLTAQLFANARLNPEITIGRQVHRLTTRSDGSAGATFGEYRETATRVGFHAAAGAAYTLGPGELALRVGVSGTGLEETLTGESTTIGVLAALGYRLVL